MNASRHGAGRVCSLLAMAAIPVLGLFDCGVIRKREALMDTAYQVGRDLARLM